MDYLSQYWPEIEQEIEKHNQAAIELSDDIAANPELSRAEYNTAKKHIAFLEERDILVEEKDNFAEYPTSYKASIGKKGGPKVAVLAEMDALPDIGHACGHNVHGMMSLLAAVGLSKVIEKIGKVDGIQNTETFVELQKTDKDPVYLTKK